MKKVGKLLDLAREFFKKSLSLSLYIYIYIYLFERKKMIIVPIISGALRIILKRLAKKETIAKLKPLRHQIKSIAILST